MSGTEKDPPVAAAVDRTVAAFPGLLVAGELDETLGLPLEVTMTPDWMGYCNAHVLLRMDHYYGVRVTFLRFLPDPEKAQIILLPAQSDEEYGATPVHYLSTEAGARVNLRRPMQRLGVRRHIDRVWSFPLVLRTGADGRAYIAVSLEGAATRPVQTRKRAVGSAPPDKPG